MEKKFGIQILFHGMMLVFFGLLFFIGTFNDEAIAAAVYSPGNLPAAVVTSLGLYPAFAGVVLFAGALYERAVHSGCKKAVKAYLCLNCTGLALFSGAAGFYAIMSVDCLGGLFPSLLRNIPIIVGAAVVLAYPLFFLGYHLAKKSDDKHLVGKIIALFIIIMIAFGAMEGLKFFFSRPRYRLAVRGFEGIGFVPWYTRFHGAPELVAALGLEAADFRSFPSGHSILSISCAYIFVSLAWLFPKLKNRQPLLNCAGFLFGLLVMFTRMVLGAHYLSDVSAGAIIGTLLSLAYTIVQHRITKRYQIQSE